MPIWGSNEKDGSENYILPGYVYGVCHCKADGTHRRIERNYVPEPEQDKYKYLKFDKEVSSVDKVVEIDDISINRR